AFFHLGQLGAFDAVVFLLQLLADADQYVPETGAPVVRGDGANAEIPPDFVELARFHGDQFEWRALALDVTPAAQELVDRFFQLGRKQNRAGFHPLEIALREVVGQAGQVVHVAVGDADDVAGQGEIRAAADVETDVQLRHLHDRLFAGHAVPDDVVHAQLELGEPLNQERFFDHRRPDRPPHRSHLRLQGQRLARSACGGVYEYETGVASREEGRTRGRGDRGRGDAV